MKVQFVKYLPLWLLFHAQNILNLLLQP